MEHSRLLRTIEEQNRKIETYQTKLRDVVQAYKDMAKEKEALEATISALNQSPETSTRDRRPAEKTAETGDTSTDSVNTSQVDGTDAAGDSVASSSDNADDTGDRLKESNVEGSVRQQVATLTNSLVTVTQQKSKLEASYIAEKKKLRQDLQEQEKTFQEERHNLLKQIQGFENDLEQWRSKVRSQQHEQEKERNDYAVMMRELQQLLTTERIGKVNLETQIEELRLQATEGHQMLQQKSELYEKTIAKLRQEVESLQTELKSSKEMSNEPSSLLMHLQKELLDLKEHEKRVVQQEQQRASEAETRLGEISRQTEERIACLEAKISEFSEMLGAAERLRIQDQQTIQKLRDRIIQLDLENNALTSASRASNSSMTSGVDEDLAPAEIVERMLRLRDVYRVACDRTDKPIDLYEALQLDQDITTRDNLHKTCREQYDQLHEEFERYKLRAQSVLKNKNSRDCGPEQEVATLKTQMADLRDRFGHLRRNFEEQELKLREKEEHLTKALTAMTERHEADSLQKDADHRQKIAELDVEIRRHRERTIVLLSEKDREIATLRLQLPPQLSETEARLSFQPSSPEPDYSEVGASSEEISAVTELLRQNPLGGIPGDPKLLHFAQEQRRKEVEIVTLRRQKHNLEMALREQQQTFHMRDQELVDKVQALGELVKKHERDKSRESANLEYLKNVIYHYLIATENSGRQPMLNAITTILEFSPKEKQQVQLATSRGWWTYKHSTAPPK